jgi:hypothetical protein
LKHELALRKARSVSTGGCFEPPACGGILVLGKNSEGAGTGIFSRGEIGAEEKEIAGAECFGEATEKGKRIEVWENSEEGEEAGGGLGEGMGLENAGERGGGGEVEFFGSFLFCGEFSSGDSGHSEGGVGSSEVGGLREFSKKKRFLEAFGTTECDYVVGLRFKKRSKEWSGLRKKFANGRTMNEGGAGEVNFFPQSGKGGVGVEGRGGQFGVHAASVSEAIPSRRG